MRGARIFGITAVAAAGVAAAGLAGLTTSSCGSTPPNVLVRSFQQARNVDYLCIAFNNPDGGSLLPTENVGLNANLCPQVPPNGNGTVPRNHMLALVTQAARGEVAVVDLTTTVNNNLGAIVDESRAAPGTNFIPVGRQPTGIVVAPDAQMTFVSSADVNKPAIYGIPTSAHPLAGGEAGGVGARTIGGVLGDSTQFPNGDVSPLTLVDLPACALPQPPQTIAVARMPAAQGGPPAGFVIVATLQQAAGSPAAVVTIDPTGLLRGVGLATEPVDGGVAGGDAALDGGEAGASTPQTAPTVTPGILAACPILGAVRLADVTAGPQVVWSPGPAWADGVAYADAGDLSSAEPSIAAACPTPAPSPGFTLPTAPGVQPYPAHAVMRDDAPLLYVADARLPEIHVIDVTDPAHPVEQPPLLATSVAQTTRQVTVGDIALSPVTREYQRFLYAVDLSDGSVMVFDVTDPVASPRAPLQRPHPELNPLLASDRLAFASPVAALAFATHDWPIIPPGPNGTTNDPVHAYSGLLCNPNPNVLVDGGAGTAGEGGVLDYGYYYTAQRTGNVYANGTVQQMPLRLRGVFAFITLSTGQVVTVDVDDWDAPCRRPDPMTIDPGHHYGMTGVLDLPEPDAGPPGSPTFLDPYAAPRGAPQVTSQPSWVTQEAFFPVSAPHRMRSMFLLRNDPVVGNNAPNLAAPPGLTDVSGTSVSVSTNGGVSALILPTALPDGTIDPSLVLDPTAPPANQHLQPDASMLPGPSGTVPGVRLSFDDPTVSQSQAWTVTYEGALPTLNSITADILAPDADAGADAGYQTLTFSIGQGLPGADAGKPLPGIGPGFCERGVEDWDLGQQRAQQALAEMTARGLPPPPDMKDWTGDYLEILDDPVAKGDPYWNVENACWDGLSSGKTDLSPGPRVPGGKDDQTKADARHDVCNQVFGTGSPDSYLARDLPILRAYDDHLDVGRFYWQSDAGKGAPQVLERTTNRKILGADPSNEKSLRFVACCFHNQATFKVRGGGEWVATGQGAGFLHHVVASSSPETDPLSGGAGSLRCVQSCNPQDVLLSSRSIDVPWAPIPWGTSRSMADGGAGEVSDAGKGMLDGGNEAGADGGTSGLDCRLPAHFTPIDRNSALALRNPFFSYVTWMACALPSSAFDHTVTLRDDAWHFQVGGGFAPLTASLTSNTLLDVSPQSMRYIQPLGWMAIIDGQSQGLEIIDLNSPVVVAHTYF
jgi:hypothetical protein